MARARKILDDLAGQDGSPDGARFFDEGNELCTAYVVVGGIDMAISYYVTPLGDIALLTVFPIEEDSYDEELGRARKEMERCAALNHAPEDL